LAVDREQPIAAPSAPAQIVAQPGGA
jgi:hypothetical protein